MGVKFCGTSTAPATFHGQTETAVVSQRKEADLANAFRYHQHLSYMIPRLHWWITSSLLYVHSKVTGALWRLWHGTLRARVLLELRLEWAARASWLQPFLSDHTLLLPVRSQRGGCSQDWPVQNEHESPQQCGTWRRHMWSLSFSPPAYFLLAGCNWKQKKLMVEERKPTDQFWASHHPLIWHPFSLTPCRFFLCLFSKCFWAPK